MKTKCLSVRLLSLESISEKAYKAKSFDGREAIIPKSQVFGQDFNAQKSDAYWISEWILEQKDIQFSRKRIAWFDHETGELKPNIRIEVETHVPKKIDPKEIKPDEDLTR